jgi:rfaE bifunctional protein nucleotidyltransferase chain/domain
MTVKGGIFDDASNFDDRLVDGYEELGKRVENFKALNVKVVLTSGSFDMIHEGHARYLESAKSHGDLLIVGVDSDAKIKQRKGPDRPVVPEVERLTMLTFLRSVDLVVSKPVDEPKWALIKAVRPDVLVATASTYKPEDVEALKEYCGKVVVLEPMATTTTSARLRMLQINLKERFTTALMEQMPAMLEQLLGDGES